MLRLTTLTGTSSRRAGTEVPRMMWWISRSAPVCMCCMDTRHLGRQLVQLMRHITVSGCDGDAAAGCEYVRDEKRVKLCA